MLATVCIWSEIFIIIIIIASHPKPSQQEEYALLLANLGRQSKRQTRFPPDGLTERTEVPAHGSR